MKKILLFVVLMILSPKFVFASEVIYTDYSEFGPYTDNYIESSELIDVKTEKRYLWKKQEKLLGDYKIYNQTDNFILEDCYDTEYSSWSRNKEEKIGRTYETRDVYNYEMSKPVRYIHITNLHGSYDAFRMTELIVKVDDIDINYSYTCEGCWSNFEKYIHNGIYDENMSYIDNGGSLIIDLKKTYPIHKLKLIFYLFDLGPDNKSYTIGYSEDKKNIFASKNFEYEFSDIHWSNSKLLSHYIYDLGISKSNWTKNVVSYSPVENEYIMSSNSYKEYRYKETYCRTYTIKDIYNTEYTKDNVEDFNIKDENSEKVYYSYRTRDKLEIQDKLVINSYDYDLNDFVISSSRDYEIIDNIDINKNGVYDITFKIGSKDINRFVEVNIINNSIKDYQNEIQSLHDVIEDLNKNIKELEEKYESEIKEKDELIENLKQELNSCKENCDTNCLKKEIEDKNKLIEEYKNEIKKLKEEIELLKQKLKDLNSEDDEIKKLNDYTSKLENEVENKLYQIECLLKENEKLKNDIVILENENIKYKKTIENLEEINLQYLNKIKELELQLHNINNNISDTVNIKNKIIEEYLIEIEKLNQENLNNINENKNINDKLEEKTIENKSLNEKLNNYMLKIRGTEKLNLFWIYILIIILLLSYILLRKKSSEK